MKQLGNNALLLNGKYKIERVLGQGGFGITYLAKQKVSVAGALGTIDAEIEVTIKEFFMKELCNRDEASSMVTVPSTGSAELVEKFRQKFIKEAKNISKLTHPHIIKVLDVFEENGTAYYVMEYIDGGSLSDLIEKKGSLSEDETLKYTRQIASALQYIHAHNMNHLDVKPGNVLLRKNGDVVLIDFGMSKNYDVAGEQTTSSPVGVSVGYAPIEQSRVGGLGMFSPETDIYSLGATMFKMLTGQTPPEATAVFDEGLPELPMEISEQTKLVIEKAMQPRRKERYHTIKEFLEALGEKASVAEETDKIRAFEETQYFPSVGITKQEKLNKVNAKLETSPKGVDVTKPKFLKKDDKEATMYISDVMVQESDIDTSDVVDLGLSIKWCGRNLWALRPKDNAAYFRWANGITEFGMSIIPAEADIAGSNKDIAYKTSGGKLKTPNLKQFKELADRCRWSSCTYNGVIGCKVTGPSGRSIFLPNGHYWSSVKARCNNAYYLHFNDENPDIGNGATMTFCSIRPICEQ